MANRLEENFVKADSRNLPKIDFFVIHEFLKTSDCFNAEEIRNAKLSMSSRENYGEQAVGYVCLQRDGPICTMKCTICPEHRVHNKGYNVTLQINEDEEKIMNVQCHNCAAANGGCKHSIAFIMWLLRRSVMPSVTETECYWKKSVLSSIGTTKKFIAAKDFQTDTDQSSSSSSASNQNLGELFLADLLKTAEEKGLDSQLTRHHFTVKERSVMSLSIHQLLIEFKSLGQQSAEDFFTFAKKFLTPELCSTAERLTRTQADSSLWHELRYGRITASKILEAAHCKTVDGSLVRQIIGAAKVFTSPEMQRGKDLEKRVLAVAAKKLNVSWRSSGFVLIPSSPILGASPDAIGEDFVIEVKCPAKATTVENFIQNGIIQGKCKAQIQLQMKATGCKKGYLCVADPNFEKSQEVTIICEPYDETYVSEIITQVESFWKHNIFKKLFCHK